MYRATYGDPSKTLSSHDFSVTFRMAMETFVSDYLRHVGLYFGRPMDCGSLYADEAKSLFKKKRRKFYSFDPATKVKSVTFINKIFEKSFRYLTEEKFLFDEVIFRKFFRFYFRKLTNIKTTAWINHAQLLSDGIAILLRETCKGKLHFINNLLIFKLVEFRLDDELERAFEFPSEFKYIFEIISNNSKSPIVFLDKENFDDLLQKLSGLTVDSNVNNKMKYYIDSLKFMIENAKSKDVDIAIRVMNYEENVCEDEEHEI
jgi:hypothetical protein